MISSLSPTSKTSFSFYLTRNIPKLISSSTNLNLKLTKCYLSTQNNKEIQLDAYPKNSKYINKQHFYQNDLLLSYSEKDQHPVSLNQLAFFGKRLNKSKIIASANFVKEELAIRLAHRIRDLQNLPYAAVNNYHMNIIYQAYYTAFESFRRFKTIKTLEENESFCILLGNLLQDNVIGLPHLLIGSLECAISEILNKDRLDDFMSIMLRSRISRRVIAEEHLSLTRVFTTAPMEKRDKDYIGEVFMLCSTNDIIKRCSEIAKRSIIKQFPNIIKNGSLIPEIIIEGDINTTFYYMPSHLQFIIGEILRNCYEATVTNFFKEYPEIINSNSTKLKPPPIIITICNSNTDVLIRFSDQGGGIKSNQLPTLWSFNKKPEIAKKILNNFHMIPGLDLYNEKVSPFDYDDNNNNNNNNENLKQTNINQISKEFEDLLIKSQNFKKTSSLTVFTTRPPNLKLDMGLPMSRVYADYWDGKLDLHSLEGYGCDTLFKIRRLETQREKLQLNRV